MSLCPSPCCQSSPGSLLSFFSQPFQKKSVHFSQTRSGFISSAFLYFSAAHSKIEAYVHTTWVQTGRISVFKEDEMFWSGHQTQAGDLCREEGVYDEDDGLWTGLEVQLLEKKREREYDQNVQPIITKKWRGDEGKEEVEELSFYNIIIKVYSKLKTQSTGSAHSLHERWVISLANRLTSCSLHL